MASIIDSLVKCLGVVDLNLSRDVKFQVGEGNAKCLFFRAIA
ncbi:hypothetical protein COLO4_00152 [Corchorus olitorius]|uniref:Uncharacterized protein n=1 Tax=Corchorus olitorius TaxID=93759 RepID=A0A1R3L4G5_9ROSI|nr:hypothetical protein COLO4_00152 [Corchorus olitorius]